jgi:hypothetical protein
MPEASEAGSRTLSRFGVEDEQIYLVIRDRKSDQCHLRLEREAERCELANE